MKFWNEKVLKHLLSEMFYSFREFSIDVQEFFLDKIQELMASSNNTSLCVYRNFRDAWELAKQYGVKVEGALILEVGAGRSFETGVFWNYVGAKKYTSVDKFIEINITDLWIKRLESLLQANLYNPNAFKLDSVLKMHEGRYLINQDRINLISAAFEEYPFDNQQFDFVYSNAFLEHVENPAEILSKIHQVMTPGGIMFHTIDLREHHTDTKYVQDKNTSVEFLAFSTEEWHLIHPPGSIHFLNRLRAGDYKKILEEIGFEIIEFVSAQEMKIDSGIYSQIHPEFHKYSLDDLKITGLQVVGRKRS
ncbi:MAG: class I SAM-dependent methyltransferase [Syntrophales bacterium LBB04]|nr:class I SAM-dependent methyltransferase [Syntrophales bacterium LBB04]